jgi:outer membrane protein assembly factor BamD (BamD/ComL family)
MLWRILLILVVAMVIGISGCAKKEEPDQPAKTVDELKAEAEKDITEENLDEELDKLEAEVEADVMAEE